jgi:hypothetical protein
MASATLTFNYKTLWTICMYIDANLKAYYDTNIIDVIDGINMGLDDRDKQRVKIVIRILMSKNVAKDFIDNQLLIYIHLFRMIHFILLTKRDELLEELSTVSEIAFDRERDGEMNAGMFLKHQNTYKDIYKIITTILQINIDNLRCISFGKEEGIKVLIVKT